MHLLSSYQSMARGRDAHKWRLGDVIATPTSITAMNHHASTHSRGNSSSSGSGGGGGGGSSGGSSSGSSSSGSSSSSSGNDGGSSPFAPHHHQRGGLRGLAPTLFILAPQDLVVARVRDVNDRIQQALDKADLRLAVDLACR